MVLSSVVQWDLEVLEEECLSGHLQVLLARLPHPLELHHLRCHLELLPLRASLEPDNHNPLKLLPLRAEASLEPLHNLVLLLPRRISVVLVLLPNAPGGRGQKKRASSLKSAMIRFDGDSDSERGKNSNVPVRFKRSSFES